MKRNPFEQIEVASVYEKWYEEAGRKAVAQEKSLLLKLLREFPEAKSILEVGSGTGYFTRWFSEQGFWSVGVDNSEAMLLEARKRGDEPYVLAEACGLPFESESVDVVAFITSLEFMDEIISALYEGIRVARQGLLLGILNKSSHLGVWRKALSIIKETPYASARFFTLGEIKTVLEDLFAPEKPQITWESTLFPLINVNAKLPWGGFLGVAVRKPKEIRGGRNESSSYRCST